MVRPRFELEFVRLDIFTINMDFAKIKSLVIFYSTRKVQNSNMTAARIIGFLSVLFSVNNLRVIAVKVSKLELFQI